MTTDYQNGDTLYRHGDVMLKKTSIPLTRDIPTAVSALLHKGENHHHMLGGEFYIREHGGEKYVGVTGPTTLTHEEHGPITLTPDGTELQVAIQLEYDHFLEESREVVD